MNYKVLAASISAQKSGKTSDYLSSYSTGCNPFVSLLPWLAVFRAYEMMAY